MKSKKLLKSPYLSLEYLIEYLKLTEHEDSAKKAISSALQLPFYLKFDDIKQLASVQKLSHSPLGQLLNIFAVGSLSEYKKFISSNQLGLNNQELLKKIKLLTFVDYCGENVGKTLNFNEIANANSIQSDQVEFWIVQAIQSNLIDAKINELEQTVSLK
jgi:translation initiation factor 3 subunit M